MDKLLVSIFICCFILLLLVLIALDALDTPRFHGECEAIGGVLVKTLDGYQCAELKIKESWCVMEHTKEPWRAECFAINDDKGRLILQIGVSADRCFFSTSEMEANARRIVACVNALKEVSTEWLEQNKSIVVLGAPIADRFRAMEAEIERLRSERDMMAEALEQVMTWIDNWSPEFTYDADWPADRDKALAALAKIKKVGA